MLPSDSGEKGNRSTLEYQSHSQFLKGQRARLTWMEFLFLFLSHDIQHLPIFEGQRSNLLREAI